MMSRRAIALVALSLALGSCSDGAASPSPALTGSTEPTAPEGTFEPGEPADILLVNAHVLTVDADNAVVEAVAIKDGDILAVGTSAEIQGVHVGSDTLVLDLEGRTVMPGFVDPHTHVLQHLQGDVQAMKDSVGNHLVHGTTTVGAPSVLPGDLEAFRQVAADGVLTTRTQLYLAYNSVCGDVLEDDFYLSEPFSQDPDELLVVAGVKIFADGGACRAPAVEFEYKESTPDNLRENGWVGHGDLYVTAEEVAGVVERVEEAGGSVVVHAIGDRAIRTALAGYEAAAEATGGFTAPKRLDHNSMVGLLTPEELGAYGRAGLFPVIQFSPWANACALGTGGIWGSILPDDALRTLEDRTFIADNNPGIEFAWHGDEPSIQGSPLQQMFSIVDRGAYDPATGEDCHPAEWASFPTVDVTEALRMTTINAAKVMGIADRVGSLEVGKVADLLILQDDPYGPDPVVALAHNRPLFTMIDGKAAYCDDVLCPLIAGIEPSVP